MILNKDFVINIYRFLGFVRIIDIEFYIYVDIIRRMVY